MARPKKLIQFYLTNRCNSRCNTCSIWNIKEQEELPLEKVIETIKDFPDADFVFGGGEFTLYSKKHELLSYCDDNDIRYTVLSNCVDFDKLVNLVLSHNIKNLTISCDGIEHDKIRGVEGNLERIKRFIQNYSHKIPNLKISYTLSKFNQKNIDKDMKLFKELGFEKIYFCIAQNMELLNAPNKVIRPGLYFIDKMYNEYGDMLYDKDIQLLEDILYGNMRECDSTDSVHTIYTNGDVVRCQSYKSNEVLFNINERPLKEIMLVDNWVCEYSKECQLVCQRRYDYEDRI